MAGDWIKMRVDLLDDPAVEGIAQATGLDRFGVIGRLHGLWSWADQQSRDGHVPHVTNVTVDKRISCEGFTDAMVKVGWLTVLSTGIRFPNFDRHNGKPAKDRALAKNRQAVRRSRDQRDNTVTREEKSSTNKHLPVANGSVAPRPPEKPPEGKSRSTPPPRTRSEANTRQQLEDQRARAGEATAPPAHVAELATRLKATTPPKPQRIPRGNGEPREALAEPEWWETPVGIQREATNRGVEVIPDQPFEDFKARVFAAAGEGPWLHHLAPQLRERVDHWRVVGVNP